MLVSKTLLFYVCTMSDPGRRRYDSPLRAAQAEQARAVIVAAATRLFTERGWNGTGMRDVARAANVSIETVYRNFGSKAELLKQAIDVSVVGDTELVPLAERDDFRQLGKGSAADRCQAVAQLLAAIWPRGARLRRVLHQAAAGDPQLSELLADSLRSERESARQAAVAVAQCPVSDEDVDALFAILSGDVFLLLTEVRGWSVSAYRSWVARTVRMVLNLKGDDDES
jgi:AcrR family transcriptional regulator